jgi:hypothetical protein
MQSRSCSNSDRRRRIYEVDHPATQAWKLERLAEAQLALPSWLIPVPVDFEQDDLGKTLGGAGFLQNSPAFFTWLGVVPYLTEEAIVSTLNYMASIQNSEMVFDYTESPQAFSEEMRESITRQTEQLAKIGERWASRFEPAGLRRDEYAAEVDVDHAIHFFQRCLLERFRNGRAGVVHQHIQPAEGCDGLRDCILHCINVGRVRLNRDGARRLAIAAPMPREPPVMGAIFPSSLPMSFSFGSPL